jgi:hypothetical protein
MARTIFFNDNANRAYPFVLGTGLLVPGTTLPLLPKATVVDFGALMGIESGYVEGQHSIWLHSVVRADNMFRFTFRSDALGLTSYELVFEFALTDSRYARQYAECQLIEGPASMSSCLNDTLWSGFMVIGSLAPLAALLAGPPDELEDGSTVEPALIRSLVMAYVRTINLANDDRTRATAPAQCTPLTDNDSDGLTHVQATCLLGHVRLEAGYNCKITQDTPNNTITIGGVDPTVAQSQAGQPCVEVPLFDGETPPDGRTRLDGALNCDEVFTSVNGVGGRVVNITSGNGVNLTFDTEHHQIVVDVNMHNMAVCTQVNPDTGENADNDCSFSASYVAMCGPVA